MPDGRNSWLTWAHVRLMLVFSLAMVVGCMSPPREPTAAGGAGVDGAGRLRYWLGAPCEGVGHVEVELIENDADGEYVLDRWVTTAAEPGVAVEYLTLGVAPYGLTEVDALQADWRDADVVRIAVHEAQPEPDGSGELGYPDGLAFTYVAVDELDGADDHAGEWYVQGKGWITSEEYRSLSDSEDMIFPFCAMPDQ